MFYLSSQAVCCLITGIVPDFHGNRLAVLSGDFIPVMYFLKIYGLTVNI